MKYSYKTSVKGYELDSFGHLNNAVYINYTEQARWEILNKKGLLDLFINHGFLLVVTETNIRYKKELKLFDEVDVETEVRFEAPYLVFDHQIKNLRSGNNAAKAIVKTLLVSKDRIPQDIPDQLLAITKS
ncbi:MAG: thioesterase family protein [Bacteroidales bacterium]|jgi:acyl-CoA thioester hydrolase|nr:thioesterase family protein [Bacteroidales bacterium]